VSDWVVAGELRTGKEFGLQVPKEKQTGRGGGGCNCFRDLRDFEIEVAAANLALLMMRVAAIGSMFWLGWKA
jgi:hypothetical protein